MLNESFSSHTVVSSIVTKGLQNLLNLPSMLLEILSAYIDSEHLDHISWHWPPCCSFIWKRHVAPCFLRSPCRQSHQCSVKHSLPTSSPLALSLSPSLSLTFSFTQIDRYFLFFSLFSWVVHDTLHPSQLLATLIKQLGSCRHNASLHSKT